MTIRGTACGKESASILAESLPGLKCEKKAAALVESIKAVGCEKKAAEILIRAASKQPCAEEIEVSAGAPACEAAKACGAENTLVTSWTQATKDISGMSAEERKTFFSRVSAVMERSELTRLLPGTLATLIEGVSVVAEMDRGIQALVDSKPQILADVPAEAKKTHEAQTKAIRDSHEVLREVKKALDAIGY